MHAYANTTNGYADEQRALLCAQSLALLAHRNMLLFCLDLCLERLDKSCNSSNVQRGWPSRSRGIALDVGECEWQGRAACSGSSGGRPRLFLGPSRRQPRAAPGQCGRNCARGVVPLLRPAFISLRLLKHYGGQSKIAALRPRKQFTAARRYT